jgi:hypothetical protein
MNMFHATTRSAILLRVCLLFQILIPITFEESFARAEYKPVVPFAANAATSEPLTRVMMKWSTYLGGEEADYGNGIALDHAGNIYITGKTQSAGWASDGYDEIYGGGDEFGDAFVAKFSNTGQHLWSTYLGGAGEEEGIGLAVDDAANVYATGFTTSAGWVSGGFDTTYHGDHDAYLVKLSSDGTPRWSCYLGGSNDDSGFKVAIDSAQNVYVSGFTSSPGWVSGGSDTTYHGKSDGFLVKLSSAGEHLWSTYLGGSENDVAKGVAVDQEGDMYVSGWTESAGWISGGFDTSYHGN